MPSPAPPSPVSSALIIYQKDSMELNFEGPEMQNWNIPTDTAQRVDEKNGVICSAIMFTLGVLWWSLKYQNGTFFEFSMDNGEMFWAKCLSAPEDLIEFFEKVVG